jgi:hypothetical protein
LAKAKQWFLWSASLIEWQWDSFAMPVNGAAMKNAVITKSDLIDLNRRNWLVDSRTMALLSFGCY